MLAPRTSVPFSFKSIPSIAFVGVRDRQRRELKPREVREILAQEGTPIEIESRDLDRECELAPTSESSQGPSQPQPTPLFYWHHIMGLF
jgi:hypothetical protein